jgi:beta-glucosidase/6-phospho-beta-glucosidase/beta-galactosidase
MPSGRVRLLPPHLAVLAAAVACSSSSSPTTPERDAGVQHDAAAGKPDSRPDAPTKHEPDARAADAHHGDAPHDAARDAGDAGDAGPPPPASVSFPQGFFWGSSTAGFQVEKGDDNTDWAAWVATAGKIANGDSPDMGGPDALDNIAADVADLVATHQNVYRFSLEWARIYPTLDAFDSDTPDPAAITAYGNLLTALVAAHIRPIVTLDHYTLPTYVDDITQPMSPQGWENASTTTMFVEFCSRMAKRWGGQVDYWLTVNEPLVLAIGGYLGGSIPPGVLFDVDRTIAVIKAQTLAHAMAYDAIHAADTVDADGDGKAALVSLAKHQRTFHPLDPTSADDIAATAHVEYLWNQWLYNVVVLGNWDDDFDGNYTGPNDKMGDPSLKGRADFLGINYYSDTLVSAHQGIIIPAPVNAGFEQVNLPTGRPKTDEDWDIYAEGIKTVVLEGKQLWDLPILITENGIADHGDVNRPRFLYDHLLQLGWAMQEGADVIGYIHWASIDNFEWDDGFCPKYGLFSYDPTTEVRTAKNSAGVYGSIIQAGSVTLAQLNASPAYVSSTAMCSM